MLRVVVLVVGIGASFWTIACDPGITIKIDNESSRAFCVYDSQYFLDQGGCSTSIKPGESIRYGYVCTSKRNASVILVDAGATFYERTATCGEWEDSGAHVLVLDRNGELIVEDSLPDTVP